MPARQYPRCARLRRQRGGHMSSAAAAAAISCIVVLALWQVPTVEGKGSGGKVKVGTLPKYCDGSFGARQSAAARSQVASSARASAPPDPAMRSVRIGAMSSATGRRTSTGPIVPLHV